MSSIDHSEKFGMPFLKSDSITIAPNVEYIVTIKLEECDTEQKITPTVAVPQRKGYIKPTQIVYNSDHVPVPNNVTTYVLNTCNTLEYPVSKISFSSDLGCMEIYYQCMVSDHRGTRFWGSSKMVPNLAMKKEIVSESKIKYYCNDSKSDKFNSYIFSVEWCRSKE